MPDIFPRNFHAIAVARTHLFNARRAFLPLVVLALAGCASAPPEPSSVAYHCEDGRSFSVSYLPAQKAASVEVSGMRFLLRGLQTSGTSERYACSMVALWRDGDTARVAIEDAPLYENCRAVR